MARSVFRQSALERLASPEKLDEPVRVVRPIGWLCLAALALAILIAVGWAAIASAPVKVQSQGILIYEGGLFGIAANQTGRIEELNLEPGAIVREGDLVGALVASDLRREVANTEAALEAALRQYRRLEAYYETATAKEAQLYDQREATIAQTSDLLSERLDLVVAKEEGIRDLFRRQQTVRDRLIAAQVQVSDTRERLASLGDELAELELGQMQRENERYLDLLERRLGIDDLERDLTRQRELLEEEEKILSPYTGRVMEVKVNRGDVINAGSELATIAPIADDDPVIVALLYLPPTEGKRVEAGMPVEIAPTTVEREEYGYIHGTVRHVAPLPASLEGMRRVLQNEQLVRSLSGDGAPFEALVELERDPSTPSGYAWSSSRGPDIEINAGTMFEGRVTVRDVRLLSLLIPRVQRLLEGDVL